jgi:hypothetical protein
MKLRILNENQQGTGILIEHSNNACTIKKVLNESTGITEYKIIGIYMMGDVKNRNGRIYPFEKVLKPEVNRYITECINAGLSGMELNHPDSLELDLERTAGVTKKLWFDAPNVMGESVLVDYGVGLLVQKLIDAGLVIGVSSRGTGSVLKNNEVDIDFRLYHIDIVGTPSAQLALVSHVTESTEMNDLVLKEKLLTEQELDNFKTLFRKLNPRDRAKSFDIYKKLIESMNTPNKTKIYK